MAECVVDRFEAVEVDEHQGEAATLLLHLFDRLIDAVVEQHAVGQTGQRIVQGQLGEFAVGHRQRVRQISGARFEAGIENRGQQGNRQHRQSGDHDQTVEAIALQAIERRAAETAVRKLRSSHAGVVHADNRHAHDYRRAGANQPYIGRLLTQAKGNPQSRCRGADGNQQGGTEQGRVVIDARCHAQRGHTGVMHGADARPHDQRTESQLRQRQFRLADQPQGETAGQHRDQQRQRSEGEVIAQVDRQFEGEHADEMHRPDANAHRQRPARRPEMHGPAFSRGNASGEIERRVGSQNGHAQRNENQGEGVAADEHGRSRDKPKPYCFHSRSGKCGDCTDCAEERTDKVTKLPSSR